MKIFFIATVLFIFYTIKAQQTSAPIAYWKINEGKGNEIIDYGPNKLNGKIINSVDTTWGTGRLNGSSLYLNNSLVEDADGEKNNGSRIEIKGADIFDFTHGMTITLWCKPSKKWKRLSRHEIISNSPPDYGSGFRFFHYCSRLCFSSGNGAKKENCSISSVPTQVLLELGSWHHLAAVFDGRVMKIYLDGMLVAESRNPDAYLTQGNSILCIGGSGRYYGFSGAISEVKLYDRALNSQEIMTQAKSIIRNSDPN